MDGWYWRRVQPRLTTHPPRPEADISLEVLIAWGSLGLLMFVGLLLIVQPA